MTITLEDFERRLAEAGGGALRRLTRETLQRAAKEAERAAKQRISIPAPSWVLKIPERAAAQALLSPVLHVRTGRLRSSIRSGVRGGVKGGHKGSIEGWIRAGGPSKKGAVKYAAVHELGLTIPHPSGGSVKMPKRPFLKPSIDDATKDLPAALAPLLAQALKADV